MSPTIDSQLEIPIQERLLPIGQTNKDVSQLVEKVRLALGLNTQPAKVLENRKNKQNTTREFIGSPSPRRLIKQVALESPPNQGDLEDHLVLFRNANIENKSK